MPRYEDDYLKPFLGVVKETGLEAVTRQGQQNRFDPGFGLDVRQQFQLGDLRVERDDRTVLVEVESGGGLTNLLKYWPYACHVSKPLVLIHAFCQWSDADYVAHHRLWEFVWARMRHDLMQHAPGRLTAGLFTFRGADPSTLCPAVEAFRRCLDEPLREVQRWLGRDG